MELNYCSRCGAKLIVKKKTVSMRHYCPGCSTWFYKNPTVGVAVIVMKDDKILLVKRLGSYEGMWCIPCGHVEWNEDIRDSAQREIEEETGLIVKIKKVFNAHSNFHDMSKQTVGIWFTAEVTGGEFKPGSDASDAAFFSLDELPEEMAFPTDLLICDELRNNKG